MRQLAKYAFANAKIRAMRSSLLEPVLFGQLTEAADQYACLEILKKTPYEGVVAGLQKGYSFEVLEKAFIKYDLAVYAKVEAALSGKAERAFVELVRQRYELEELKVILRIWHHKLPVDWHDHVIPGRICYEIDFAKLAAAQHIEEFILLLDHTPYKNALMKARQAYKERRSSFYLEAALDVDYYERLIACIAKFSSVDRAVASRILGIEVDIENINWLIRLRKYYSLGIGEMLEWFIPGGQWIHKDEVRKYYTTDGLAKVVESVSLGPYARIKDLAQDNVMLIENFLYEVLLREVKLALSGFPFTIGTVMGYLVLKQKETRNVLSLLHAKEYGWQKEEIAPLLSL
ncbi:MAG TPA: V-type ATPase subunit [Candidatus Omnitrophota bacterium]|nr:V-type ATPase subunit [Candidatus Omnitrophota bacterium]HNQ50967.1 V-type ATPase subunit [Candidatus Omnitrophota bacterium]